MRKLSIGQLKAIFAKLGKIKTPRKARRAAEFLGIPTRKIKIKPYSKIREIIYGGRGLVPGERITKATARRDILKGLDLLDKEAIVNRLAKYKGWATTEKTVWEPSREALLARKLHRTKLTPKSGLLEGKKAGEFVRKKVVIPEKLPEPLRPPEVGKQFIRPRQKMYPQLDKEDLKFLRMRSSSDIWGKGPTLKIESYGSKASLMATIKRKEKLVDKIKRQISFEKASSTPNRYKTVDLQEQLEIIEKSELPQLRSFAKQMKEKKIGKFSSVNLRKELAEAEARETVAGIKVKKGEALKLVKMIHRRQQRAAQGYRGKMARRRLTRLYPGGAGLGISGGGVAYTRRKKEKKIKRHKRI